MIRQLSLPPGDRYYRAQYEVPSFTNPNADPYKVSLTASGEWQCSCKSWIFARRRRGECKHILRVREELTTIPRPRATRPRATPPEIKKPARNVRKKPTPEVEAADVAKRLVEAFA